MVELIIALLAIIVTFASCKLIEKNAADDNNAKIAGKYSAIIAAVFAFIVALSIQDSNNSTKIVISIIAALIGPIIIFYTIYKMLLKYGDVSSDNLPAESDFDSILEENLNTIYDDLDSLVDNSTTTEESSNTSDDAQSSVENTDSIDNEESFSDYFYDDEDDGISDVIFDKAKLVNDSNICLEENKDDDYQSNISSNISYENSFTDQFNYKQILDKGHYLIDKGYIGLAIILYKESINMIVDEYQKDIIRKALVDCYIDSGEISNAKNELRKDNK